MTSFYDVGDNASRISSYTDNSSSTSLTSIDRNESINPRCFEELPDDLLIQIFIRASVKSLLLGMCVCKHWYFVIKDPSFVRKHLQFQKMISRDCGQFLLEHEDEIARVYNFFLFDDKFFNSTMSSTLPSTSYRNLFNISLVEDYNQLEIDGPINGLYCLHDRQNRFVIWNPATNAVVFLPFPEDQIPHNMYDAAELEDRKWLEEGVIGFGTDPLDEEDYKVIVISQLVDFEDFDHIHGMLYTTKTNSWRIIKDEVVSVRRSLNNTYLNGRYYWTSVFKYTALVFNMSKNEESFRKMTTPCHDADLALNNDRITLFSVNKNLNTVEIWVMLEESNWLKTISVEGIQGSVVRSLGFWKTENQIFLVIVNFEETSGLNNKQTVLYNTTTRETMNIGPRGRSRAFRASIYYKSLVSITDGINKFKGNSLASLLNEFWFFLLKVNTDCDEE